MVILTGTVQCIAEKNSGVGTSEHAEENSGSGGSWELHFAGCWLGLIKLNMMDGLAVGL